MNISQLRKAIDRCIHLDVNDDYGFEACCKEMTDILSEDVPASIQFLLHQCTDEEFYWLSPVFSDVSEKVKSMELVGALRTRLRQVTPENYHQQDFESEHMRKWVDYNEYVRSISNEIAYADGQLEY